MQTPKLRPGSLEVPQKKSPTATPRTARKLKTADADPVSSPNPKIRTPKTQSPKVVADRRSPKAPVNEKLDEDDEQSSILFNFFLKKLDSHLSFFDCHMMSSGCEDSSVNTMGIRGIPEQCGCGRRTGIYTSKTKENPGRTFFRCPTFRNDHLYKWVDEAVYEEVQDALPKVDCFASDLRKLKMEIDSLKNEEEELKEDLRKATNEVKKLNVIMKVGFLVASVSCIVFFMRKRQ